MQRTGTDVQDREEDGNWRTKFPSMGGHLGFTFCPSKWLGVSIPDMEIEFTAAESHPYLPTMQHYDTKIMGELFLRNTHRIVQFAFMWDIFLGLQWRYQAESYSKCMD